MLKFVLNNLFWLQENVIRSLAEDFFGIKKKKGAK